jgi:hypothetical protein
MSPQVNASQYILPPIRAFTADECMQQLNKVNHKVVTEHSLGALVE